MTRPRPPMNCLYRYNIVIYADGPRVALCTFAIAHRTPKGARLQFGKFVLLSARKKFACETIEEARESFLARTARHEALLRTQLAHIHAARAWLDANGWPDPFDDCTALLRTH